MRVLSLAAALAAIVVLAFPTGSDSCSIAPPVPVFATAQRPADLDAFRNGRIGVIRPSYQRRYLIGAYRALSGRTLALTEAQAVYGTPAPVPWRDPSAAWVQLRDKAGVAGPRFFATYKTKTAGGLFVAYPNCLDDAFELSLKTYEKRAAEWGSQDPRLHEWLAAQDQVFANCSGKDDVIPTPAAPGADPLLAADRRYQIAAAYFYASDWAKAQEAFQEVARDPSSPWKAMAPYLIARTYIRQGTVDEDPEALPQAARLLQAIVDDPAQENFHEASRKLLDYVRLRIDPAPRMAELGGEVAGLRPSSDLAQSTADFLYLYRRMTEKAGASTTDLAASSDLADWMLSFEGRRQDAAPHALEQWKKTGSRAWLVAALAHGSDPDAIRAARRTDPKAPEYEAVTYYGLVAEADPLEARQWADEALKQQLSVSARNLILEQRLKSARDWSEFLRFAPRQPEPKLQNFDGREEDIDKPPASTGAAPLFDQDGARALNWQIPLSLWRDAARNSLLPPPLQLQAAEAAWVRALVLGKGAEARELIQRVVELYPAYAAPAHGVIGASDAEAARFAGVYLLLRTPGLRSSVNPGDAAGDLTRASDLGAISWGFAQGCLPEDSTVPRQPPAFLNAAQQAENAAEWKQLEAAAPSGGSYLAAQVMAWARSHPDDPRLPEALHLVVQAGRRACRGAAPSEYGRAAFELLHRRYPKSEWAQKTKYWYQ